MCHTVPDDALVELLCGVEVYTRSVLFFPPAVLCCHRNEIALFRTNSQLRKLVHSYAGPGPGVKEMARRLKRILSLCSRRGFLLKRESAADSVREFDYGPSGTDLKRSLVNEWCVN